MIMFLLRPMFQTTINCTRNTLLNYIPFINAYITQHSKFRTIENLFIQQDMYMSTVSLSQPIHLIQVHICRTSHNANCINENNIKLNIFSFYPLQTFLNYGIIILILQQRRCITERKLCYITSFFV